MFKLAGAVMILLSSGWLGIIKSERLRKRTENIEKIISALNLLENEISYGRRDIKTALKSTGDTQRLTLFSEAAELMDSLPAGEALSRAVGNQRLCLIPADCEVLNVLAEKLGMTDCATQIKSIDFARKQLENLAVDSHAVYEKMGRMYRGIGFLAGGLAVIMLF